MSTQRRFQGWNRCCRIEQLENRALLAVAAFGVNLYEDVGGQPGNVITDDTVEVGETFFVEIMARELHPVRAGFAGIGLDIAWNPETLREIDAPFTPADVITPHLPIFLTGTLDNASGTIEDLGGSSFTASNVGRPIGNLIPERFALLHFEALGTGESAFSMRQGRSAIATMPVSSLSGAHLRFESQTITVLPAEEALSTEDTGFIEPGDSVPADALPVEASENSQIAVEQAVEQTAEPTPVVANGTEETTANPAAGQEPTATSAQVETTGVAESVAPLVLPEEPEVDVPVAGGLPDGVPADPLLPTEDLSAGSTTALIPNVATRAALPTDDASPIDAAPPVDPSVVDSLDVVASPDESTAAVGHQPVMAPPSDVEGSESSADGDVSLAPQVALSSLAQEPEEAEDVSVGRPGVASHSSWTDTFQIGIGLATRRTIARARSEGFGLAENFRGLAVSRALRWQSEAPRAAAAVAAFRSPVDRLPASAVDALFAEHGATARTWAGHFWKLPRC